LSPLAEDSKAFDISLCAAEGIRAGPLGWRVRGAGVSEHVVQVSCRKLKNKRREAHEAAGEIPNLDIASREGSFEPWGRRPGVWPACSWDSVLDLSVS